MKRLIGLTLASLAFGSLVIAQPGSDYYHHHHSSDIPEVNYDSLFEAAAALNSSERGAELIQGCLTKYGGEEKLRELKTCRLKYNMYATLTKGAVNVIKTFAEDRQYHIMRHSSSGVERRILNGRHAWQDRSDSVFEGGSARYKSELFSFLTARMPLTMVDEQFSEIRYGLRQDDSLEYVYMFKPDSLMLIAGIDPRDSTIRTSEGVIYDDTAQFVFKNTFTDYQQFDGYLFARGLVNISMGLMVAQSTLVRVDINPQLEPNEFEPVDRDSGPKFH